MELERDPRADEDADARPTRRLPLAQLLQLSVYWFGINASWGAFEVFQQERVPQLVDPAEAGRWLAVMEVFAAAVAIIVQPTIGTISDYTISRWGRRKPYIAIGAVIDVVAVVGLLTAQTYLWFVAFLLLLQFSSNFAQGPFQGYVPDLVPEEQVGLASSLMGLMIFLGLIAGTLVVSAGYQLGGDFFLPLLSVALIEFATAMGTVLFVREGRAAQPRAGRSWLRIALGAWGTDILAQRDYLWLLASRLFVLAAGAFFANLGVLYLERSLGFGDAEKAIWVPAGMVVIAVSTVTSTAVAGLLSDRLGRKRMIYLACALGAVSMSVVTVAPSIELVLAGLVLFGIANGSFISADWALMTDIIPKASAGRYMGISNLATGLQAPVAVIVGGILMDVVGGPALGGDGPRAAFAAAVAFYVVGGLLLRPVREPARRRGAGPPLRTGLIPGPGSV